MHPVDEETQIVKEEASKLGIGLQSDPIALVKQLWGSQDETTEVPWVFVFQLQEADFARQA